MTDDGILLLKYWLEVQPRGTDPAAGKPGSTTRKIWKLSPMDLRSYSRWYDYSGTRRTR
jgi:polyphosphate kinase 2 (PPK2 family)